MINHLMYGIFIASLCSSIISIVLRVFKFPIIKRIGAIWYYYFCFSIFIPWLGFWLPLPISFSGYEHLKIYAASHALNSAFTATTTQFHFTSLYIFGIWLLGALVMSVYMIINHLLFSYRLARSSRSLSHKEQSIVNDAIMIGQRTLLRRIYISNCLTSPLVSNIYYTKIYLHDDFFNSYTMEERQFSLQHELVHLKRNDLLSNTLSLTLLCLNWFNPLIYLAHKNFRQAQELACDAAVTQHQSVAVKKQYGYALLKTVLGDTLQSHSSCAWNTHSELKERCLMLQHHQYETVKNITGLILFGILMLIALAFPRINTALIELKMSEIRFTAGTIKYSGNTTLLIGDVQVHIGSKILITANKASVNYAGEDHHISEITIYGSALLQDGNKTLQLENAVLDPNTMKLNARIKQIQY